MLGGVELERKGEVRAAEFDERCHVVCCYERTSIVCTSDERVGGRVLIAWAVRGSCEVGEKLEIVEERLGDADCSCVVCCRW